MTLISSILVFLIAMLHTYICWFEMFAWEKRGPVVFPKIPKDVFPRTKEIAANQGLYNAFLAAGLGWSLVISDVDWSANVALFFLSCILVAGVFGAYTLERKIFFIQSMPAAIAILTIIVL